ncbi:MAG: hypothetical protein IIZ92_10175 [Aquincola sp.]|nr:hypothetical protein [Aquincola sp.]
MSRSGFTDSDECDQWAMIRWRGAVTSSIRGARGQAFLRELAAAMDAMPEKVLIANAAVADGAVCTLGVVAQARGLDLQRLDVAMEDWDWDHIGKELGISPSLAREVMYENDEAVNEDRYVDVEICGPVRPWLPEWGSHQRTFCVPDPRAGARRWRYMRDWVARHLVAAPHGEGER